MAKTHRATLAALVMTVLACTSAAAASNVAGDVDVSSGAVPLIRVRGATARLDEVISGAVARSATFRGLLDSIVTTDGIVYIVEGQCPQGVRACLLTFVAIAGPYRLLRIVVDPRKSDDDLMGSIGHELQHAIEVLSNHYIRTSAAATLRLKQICNVCGPRFETKAAVKAGDTIRAELRNTEPFAHH